MSSHKKGTAPSQTNCCVISQERDCSLKNKDLNKIVATDHKMRVGLWNLVTTCGMALRLEILIAWVLYHPKRGQAMLKKKYSNIFLIALETRPVLHNG